MWIYVGDCVDDGDCRLKSLGFGSLNRVVLYESILYVSLKFSIKLFRSKSPI